MISTVIYFLGKVLTFPGAYIKAFFEHLIARAFSIPVEDTKYLRFTDGCGHVEHDAIGSKAKIFFYCLLPGLFTAIIGTPMLYMGFAGLFFFKIPADSSTMLMFIVYCILFYLGFSLCANQYPLMEDAIGLWHALYGKDGANLFVKIVLFIPTVLIIAGAFLERYALNILLMAGTVAFAALTA